MQRQVGTALTSVGDVQVEVRNDTTAECGCSTVCTWQCCSSWHDVTHESHVTLQHLTTVNTSLIATHKLQRCNHKLTSSDVFFTHVPSFLPSISFPSFHSFTAFNPQIQLQGLQEQCNLPSKVHRTALAANSFSCI